MRIAVISDTHMPKGGRALPESCLARLRAADLVLHAGDLVARSFLEELRALGPPVEAVHGNVDEPALQAMLPAERVVEAAGFRIGMLHDGGPRAGRETRLAAGAVVYGHSHLPQVEEWEGVWILNPGSPTERRRAPTRTMIELRIARGRAVPELVHLGP